MVAQDKQPKAVPRKGKRLHILFGMAIGLVCLVIVWSARLSREKSTPRETSAVSVPPISEAKAVASGKVSMGRRSKDAPHPSYAKKINPALPPKKYIPTVEEVENARLGPDGRPRPMSIYRTPVEQALGMIFTTELGSPPPMLPDIPRCTSKEVLDEFLSRTFAYDKNATTAINENRIIMQQVRDELKNYIDGGGDIGGFIDFYVGELRASHEQWKTAQTMLVDMARAGEDAESLRTFRDAANRLLAEKGIKPLTVPPSVRRAMGEE